MTIVAAHLRPPQQAPLTLRFKTYDRDSLESISKAIKTCEALVNGAASEKAADTVYGQKLRNSATIKFIIGKNTRVVRPMAIGTSYEDGKVREILPAAEEAWPETVKQALLILGRMRQYAVAAEELMAIERRVAMGEYEALNELPELPRYYTKTYVANIFGSKYQQLRDHLVRDAARLKELESAISAKEKDLLRQLDEACMATGTVVDQTQPVETPVEEFAG